MQYLFEVENKGILFLLLNLNRYYLRTKVDLRSLMQLGSTICPMEWLCRTQSSGLFRTLSNIYNRAFVWKQSDSSQTGLKSVSVVQRGRQSPFLLRLTRKIYCWVAAPYLISATNNLPYSLDYPNCKTVPTC